MPGIVSSTSNMIESDFEICATQNMRKYAVDKYVNNKKDLTLEFHILLSIYFCATVLRNSYNFD